MFQISIWSVIPLFHQTYLFGARAQTEVISLCFDCQETGVGLLHLYEDQEVIFPGLQISHIDGTNVT